MNTDDILFSTIDRLLSIFVWKDYAKRNISSSKDGMYSYYKNDIKKVYNDLSRVVNFVIKNSNNEVRFIECGSGIPAITYLAFRLYSAINNGISNNSKYTFHAIEIDEELCREGKLMFECTSKDFDIYNKDIMDIDYAKYNCVYFYRPFRAEDKELKFEKKICSELPIGAVVLPYLKQLRFQDYGFIKDKSKTFYIKEKQV